MKFSLHKVCTAWKLYRFGTFSILFNKLFSGYVKFQTFLLYFFDLDKKPPPVILKDPSLRIKKVEDDEDELFQKFRQKFPAEEFVNRINKKNRVCYVVLKGSEVVAYAWVAFEILFIDAINRSYALKPDEIFLYACYVDKNNRGSGIYPALLRNILNDYHETGTYSRAYIGVNSENAGSIRGIEKAGFKYFNKIRYKKLLSKEKWKISGNPPLPATTEQVTV